MLREADLEDCRVWKWLGTSRRSYSLAGELTQRHKTPSFSLEIRNINILNGSRFKLFMGVYKHSNAKTVGLTSVFSEDSSEISFASTNMDEQVETLMLRTPPSQFH